MGGKFTYRPHLQNSDRWFSLRLAACTSGAPQELCWAPHRSAASQTCWMMGLKAVEVDMSERRAISVTWTG